MIREMFHIILIIALAVTFNLGPNAVHASSPEAKVEVVPATTPEAFAKQAEEVNQGMAPGERYGAISPADRKKVAADITKIAGLLEQVGSAEKLHNNEWVLLVNAQEHANALLTKNDGDRLICRYEKRTGSHFRVKTCQTAREIADTRRNSSQWLLEFTQHLGNVGPKGGG